MDDGVIIAILPKEEIDASYQAETVVNLPGQVLMPGLVNAHTHTSMTLMRGLKDDVALMDWLKQAIWPVEQQFIDADFIKAGTELAIAEMIASGTTCFNDMYFFPGVVARTAERMGIRACIGLILLDAPTAWAQSADEYLHKGLALHDQLRDSTLITTAFAPHAPYTVSDEPLQKVQTLADELDIPIHMHVHETADEIEQSIQRYGVRPLERLANLGLLTPRLMAVHMTQLLADEIRSIAKVGLHVIHCAESNLKLASGLCPAADLIDAGLNLALGTDGASSNNDLDMLGEMRTAALLAKGVSGKANALNAEQTLRAATINGARALGLDNKIGSIEIGKQADLIALDLSHPSCQPVYDPLSQVVYSASRDQVSNVWVNGRQLYADGNYLNLDIDSITHQAQNWAGRIRSYI